MSAIDLPPGYTAHPGSFDLIDEIAAMVRVAMLDEGGRPGWTADDLRVWWGNGHIDVSRDVIAVRDAQGAIVASEFIDCREPHVRVVTLGNVHPDHRGKGLGTALLQWAGRRGLEKVPLAPAGALVALESWIFADHEPSVALMKAEGMALERYFLEMEIDLTGDLDLAPPEFPAGVTVRTYRPGADDAATAALIQEAFRDHFGHVEVPDDVYLARFVHHMDHPDFDPTLWWLAEAGGELVAASLCIGTNEGNTDQGYVETLGVAREWRGRGIGRALLLLAFHEMARRGKESVSLGVDADSLTGATRLYESVGMWPVSRYADYERTLRPGVELRRRT